MQSSPLAAFTERKSETNSAAWSAFLSEKDGQPCRVVTFSPDASANGDFRAAWRRDTGLLRTLSHDALPEILDDGDDQGIVYSVTSAADAQTLTSFLRQHALQWDEIADIGWQVSSVIQHLHNAGLVHSGLSGDTIRITPHLRVIVVDTGIARWLEAVKDPSLASNLTHKMQQDLVSLGGLLQILIDADDGVSHDVPSGWRYLVADLTNPSSDRFPETAREVQGRLGEILLQDSGESINIVDDRTGPGSSRRSIIDEVLEATPDEDPGLLAAEQEAGKHQPTVTLLQVLIVLAFLIALFGLVMRLRG